MAIETFDSLIYPVEMRPERFYPEAMCFTVKKRIGIGLDDVAGAVQTSMDTVTGKWKSQSSLRDQYEKDIANATIKHQADKTAMENALAKLKTTFESKSNKDSLAREVFNAAADGVKQVGGLYAEQKRIERQGTTENNIGHIYLNMPQAISYDDSISWDAKPLGAVGSIMDSGLGTAAAGGTVGVAGNIAGAGIGGMMGALAGKLNIPMGIGLGAFAGGLAGGGVQSGLEATLGMTSNPYEEMMFSGITFRSFNFDFIFRPEDGNEIRVVDKIIKAFRRYSRPSFVTTKALGKTIMNYPMEYDIEFLTADKGDSVMDGRKPQETADDDVYKVNTHLPFIKTCVCEKVSTNYTPQSVWAAYNSGAPVAIGLSLGFKEKERIKDFLFIVLYENNFDGIKTRYDSDDTADAVIDVEYREIFKQVIKEVRKAV